MKKIVLLLTICISLFANMEVGKEIKNFKLKNQFDKTYTITNKTKKIIFVFNKANAHIVKDYLSKKQNDFLDKKDILFVADVSAMPSFIAWFVLPGLKDNKYSIIVLKDDEISKDYKTKQNEDKIVVVSLNNKKITNISYFTNEKEFIQNIEN